MASTAFTAAPSTPLDQAVELLMLKDPARPPGSANEALALVVFLSVNYTLLNTWKWEFTLW